MRPMSSAPRPARDGHRLAARLLTGAYSVLIDQGLAGASARSIAVRAGSSASAIHYHFERVDELIRAALDDARERDVRWRYAALDKLPQAALEPALLPHFLTGVIDTAGRAFSELALLRWDVALEAALHGRFVKVACQWREDLNAFWSAVLSSFGITASASIVAEFADAVGRIYLVAGSGPTHIAWVTETCARCAERLCGVSLSVRKGRIWRDLHLPTVARTPTADQSASASSSTAHRIVDGALDVILTQGPRAMTHRAVAAAAGVSLSSTTYHFASREEILHAAFARLRAITVARTAGPGPRPPQTLTLDELIERMGGALVPNAGAVSREYLAAQSLIHATARDAALREHAQHLYARMGEPTLHLFRLTSELRNRSDALSAFIFALWTDAMLCNASLESAQSIAAHVRTQQRAMLRLLFDS